MFMRLVQLVWGSRVRTIWAVMFILAYAAIAGRQVDSYRLRTEIAEMQVRPLLSTLERAEERLEKAEDSIRFWAEAAVSLKQQLQAAGSDDPISSPTEEPVQFVRGSPSVSEALPPSPPRLSEGAMFFEWLGYSLGVGNMPAREIQRWEVDVQDALRPGPNVYW